MQSSSTASPSTTGELIATFRHRKGALIFCLAFAAVLLGVAVFVLYLGTILLPGNEAPVGRHATPGQSDRFIIYGTSVMLAVCALGVLGMYAWQKKLRRYRYDVYEHGIARISTNLREYTPFVDIEDLYLFGSGQASAAGLITNLAYRRTAAEPFHRVYESLKGFYDFEELVRELHVRARLPGVLDTLESGGVVTFNYISTSQVWTKFFTGNFLQITTAPLVVTRDALHVQGRTLAMATLRTVDLSAWTEKVVIKDETGRVAFSTIATGILSHDLFLTTLDALLGAQAEQREEVA